MPLKISKIGCHAGFILSNEITFIFEQLLKVFILLGSKKVSH